MEALETEGGADGAAALTCSDPSWRKESVFLRSDPAFRLLPAALQRFALAATRRGSFSSLLRKLFMFLQRLFFRVCAPDGPRDAFNGANIPNCKQIKAENPGCKRSPPLT